MKKSRQSHHQMKSRAKFAAMKFFLPVLYAGIISAFFSCNRPPENSQLNEREMLAEAFEKNWGKTGSEADSARLKLAGLPGRNEYILYARAWKKAKESRFAEALKTADSLVMGYPRFEKGIFLRANLRLENGDTSGSLGDFERCLKRNPDFFECRMNRGALFFVRKMPDLAFQDFKVAQRLRPSDPEALRNLGNSFLALGQSDSACVQWKKSLASGGKDMKDLIQKYCIESSK